MRRALLATFIAGLAGFAALGAATKPAYALEYTLDPHHTQVRFGWEHFGFSFPEANFNEVNGTLIADPDHPEQSSVSVTIPVDSIDTHVKLLDEHLLNKPEFFHPKQFPDITFKSTGISNISADKKHFDVTGTLTVNGIAKPVVLHTTLNKLGTQPLWNDAKAAGFTATTTLKRSDFGMDAYVPNVSDTLAVRITAEAIETKAYDAKMQQMQPAKP
jgi:polyisoprenoid-binding protein YceI